MSEVTDKKYKAIIITMPRMKMHSMNETISQQWNRNVKKKPNGNSADEKYNVTVL